MGTSPVAVLVLIVWAFSQQNQALSLLPMDPATTNRIGPKPIQRARGRMLTLLYEKRDDVGISNRDSEFVNAPLLSFETPPKMIVFDKDGTLGDDAASMKRWMNHMTNRFEESLRQELNRSESEISTCVDSLHRRLGWDSSIGNVIPSAPLAADTWETSVETCCVLAESCGLLRTLPREWHAELRNVHGADSPIIPDLQDMIRSCRTLGLTIAICTSDNRSSTEDAMNNWKINDLIDWSVCGDEVTRPKPSPVPLELLCEKASVKPRECIVVGDTTGDTGMAQNAKAGLCIGVLSGSGAEEQLRETGADVILPDVGHIPRLLKGMGLSASAHPKQTQ